MRKLLKIPLLALGAFFTTSAYAQDNQIPGMYPEYVDFAGAAPSFIKGSIFLRDQNGRQISSNDVMLKNVENDQLGMQHYRYQQSYLGIPVEDAVYIMHVKNGKVVSENGKWIKDFPSNLSASPSLSMQEALQRAMNYVGAQSYKWQIPAEEAFIKQEQNDPNATFYPKKEIVFYSGENDITPAALRLAYKLDIYANYPMSHQFIYVDAMNGKILGQAELMHNADVTGTAYTVYSGTQTITTDKVSSTKYRLRETGRGLGIQTYNMRTAGGTYSSAVDFTDADNSWNNVNTYKDQYATDAHWAAEKTYDFYKSKFNRNSVNNAGLIIKSYVHVDLSYFGSPDNINAFWDGSRMSYGDGGTTSSGLVIKPLTTVDIAGHEITHAVTTYTSNLTYSNESGALNEGFSDIFGTAIEFYAKPATANWLIGTEIGESFRSMSNPNQYGQPDTYHGTNWYTGTSDHGGVHTNSGVINYWFYLLAHGGSGTNDNGAAYNVPGTGIDKAAAIAYRTNTVYLTSTSNYANARTYGIKSAEDLYGVGSTEALQTSCAFAAVGIGACNQAPPATCDAPTALNTTNITATGAKLNWTAASGASNYKVEYKASSATTWTTATASITATTFTLSGLSASTMYNWRVTTSCSGTASAATTASFTTDTASTPPPTPCDAPTGLTSTNITDAGAQLNWTAASGAVSYKVEYKTSAASSWTTVNASTTTTSYTLSGLGASTAYQWRITTNCSSTTSNATTASFTTTAAPTTNACQSNYDQVSNNTMATAATVPSIIILNGLISPSGDVDYYKFTIQSSGYIVINLYSIPANYDVAILNSSGTTVASSSNSGTTDEQINQMFTAGTYYAKVTGKNGANDASDCYKLQIYALNGIAANNSELGDLDRSTLRAYPNPASNELNVVIPGNMAENSTLSILDINGKVVAQQKATAALSKIDINKLPKGFYLLRVNDDKNVQSVKFTKQ